MRRILACTAPLLLSACASLQLSLPAITETPTGEHHAGRIVWHDLLTDEPEAVRTFYATLFGWEFEPVGLDIGLGDGPAYYLIRHQGRLIAGMADLNQIDTGGRDKERLSQWVALMSVPDVDAAAARVTAAGGRVLTPPTDVADRGRLALIEDNQGAFIALLETRDGDPPETDAPIGGFLWDELWASDVDAATDFYVAVTGASRGDYRIDAQRSYRYLASDGEARAGILPRPDEELPPVWVSYLRVAEADAITAQVPALGGRVLLAPQPRDVGGEVAVITDPSGAGLALQTWEEGRRLAGHAE